MGEMKVYNAKLCDKDGHIFNKRVKANDVKDAFCMLIFDMVDEFYSIHNLDKIGIDGITINIDKDMREKHRELQLILLDYTHSFIDFHLDKTFGKENNI